MNTFLGFGREHVERHYRKTGQSVYMHLKRTVKKVGAATPHAACTMHHAPYVTMRRGARGMLSLSSADISVSYMPLSCFLLQNLLGPVILTWLQFSRYKLKLNIFNRLRPLRHF